MINMAFLIAGFIIADGIPETITDDCWVARSANHSDTTYASCASYLFTDIWTQQAQSDTIQLLGCYPTNRYIASH